MLPAAKAADDRMVSASAAKNLSASSKTFVCVLMSLDRAGERRLGYGTGPGLTRIVQFLQ